MKVTFERGSVLTIIGGTLLGGIALGMLGADIFEHGIYNPTKLSEFAIVPALLSVIMLGQVHIEKV